MTTGPGARDPGPGAVALPEPRVPSPESRPFHPMSDLDDLYQSLILDHNRRPRNWGAMDGADREERARNPLCGDEVTLWLRLDGDTIADVRFEGVGCAIS